MVANIKTTTIDARNMAKNNRISGKPTAAIKFFVGGATASAALLFANISRSSQVLKFAKDVAQGLVFNFAVPALFADAVLSFAIKKARKVAHKMSVIKRIKIAGIVESELNKIVENIGSPASESEAKLKAATNASKKIEKRMSNGYFSRKQIFQDDFFKILEDRVYGKPNAFMQELFNSLNFRNVQGGDKLPQNLDVGLSAVYSAFKEYKTALYKEKITDAESNSEQANQLKPAILKELDKNGVDYSFLNKVILWKDRKNTEGKNEFVDVAELFLEGTFDDLVEATFRKDAAKVSAFKTKFTNYAKKIKEGIDLLNLTDEQKIGIRRQACWKNKIKQFKIVGNNNELDANLINPTNVDGSALQSIFCITKNQAARLLAINSMEYKKAIHNKTNSSFISKDWLIGAAEAKNRKLNKLCFDICREIGGYEGSFSSFKSLTADARRTKISNIKESDIENLRNSLDPINYGAKDSKHPYYIYKNKLIKERGLSWIFPKTKLYKKNRIILKNTPEFKKTTLSHNFMPVASFILKKAFGTLLVVGASAAIILSGVGALASIGAGIIGAGAIASKIAEKKYGPFPFFTKKAVAYRKMCEENAEGVYRAQDNPVFTKRFEAVQTKNLFKRFLNRFAGKMPENELFNSYNSNEKNANTTKTLTNLGAVYGVTAEDKLGMALINANKKSELLAVKKFGEVRYLEMPLEFYIKNTNGKVVQAFSFNNRTLAIESFKEIAKTVAQEGTQTIEILCDDIKHTVFPSQLECFKNGKNDELKQAQILQDIAQMASPEKFARKNDDILNNIHENDYLIKVENARENEVQFAIKPGKVKEFSEILACAKALENLRFNNIASKQNFNFDSSHIVAPGDFIEPREIIDVKPEEVGAVLERTDDANLNNNAVPVFEIPQTNQNHVDNDRADNAETQSVESEDDLMERMYSEENENINEQYRNIQQDTSNNQDRESVNIDGREIVFANESDETQSQKNQEKFNETLTEHLKMQILEKFKESDPLNLNEESLTKKLDALNSFNQKFQQNLNKNYFENIVETFLASDDECQNFKNSQMFTEQFNGLSDIDFNVAIANIANENELKIKKGITDKLLNDSELKAAQENYVKKAIDDLNAATQPGQISEPTRLVEHEERQQNSRARSFKRVYVRESQSAQSEELLYKVVSLLEKLQDRVDRLENTENTENSGTKNENTAVEILGVALNKTFDIINKTNEELLKTIKDMQAQNAIIQTQNAAMFEKLFSKQSTEKITSTESPVVSIKKQTLNNTDKSENIEFKKILGAVSVFIENQPSEEKENLKNLLHATQRLMKKSNNTIKYADGIGMMTKQKVAALTVDVENIDDIRFVKFYENFSQHSEILEGVLETYNKKYSAIKIDVKKMKEELLKNQQLCKQEHIKKQETSLNKVFGNIIETHNIKSKVSFNKNTINEFYDSAIEIADEILNSKELVEKKLSDEQVVELNNNKKELREIFKQGDAFTKKKNGVWEIPKYLENTKMKKPAIV